LSAVVGKPANLSFDFLAVDLSFEANFVPPRTAAAVLSFLPTFLALPSCDPEAGTLGFRGDIADAFPTFAEFAFDDFAADASRMLSLLADRRATGFVGFFTNRAFVEPCLATSLTLLVPAAAGPCSENSNLSEKWGCVKACGLVGDSTTDAPKTRYSCLGWTLNMIARPKSSRSRENYRHGLQLLS